MSGTLGATIAGLSALGYTLAGSVLGTTYTLYRPTPAAASIGTLLADFPTDATTAYKAPSKFGAPMRYGLLDTSALLPGDYAVGALGTLFLASQEANVASLWVECNRVISAGRPGKTATDPGINPGYQSTSRAIEKSLPLFTGWPCSILQGTRGEAGPMRLPAEPRVPWWAIIIPVTVPVQLLFGDQIFDDMGRVFTVSSAELSSLGWRCTATQSVA